MAMHFWIIARSLTSAHPLAFSYPGVALAIRRSLKRCVNDFNVFKCDYTFRYDFILTDMWMVSTTWPDKCTSSKLSEFLIQKSLLSMSSGGGASSSDGPAILCLSSDPMNISGNVETLVIGSNCVSITFYNSVYG